MRLAIAESDPVTADVLAFSAQRRGHQTVVLASAGRLFDRLPFEPAVIILSAEGAPNATVAFVTKVRQEFPEAALYVTVEKPKEPLPSRILEAGASDVIRSPYNPNELILRAESWLASRGVTAANTDSLTLSDLQIALDRHTATKNGKVLVLTKLELRLLYCLCDHFPHLAPLERLLTFGWDTLGDPDAALIKTHISHIRKKLRDAGGEDFEIISRQTVGYVLQLKPDTAAR